ncbi:L-threonylcarbamoyladenylate synthase [Chloroflexota bacterium]
MVIINSQDIQKQIEQGISILRQDGIVAFPTDTIYGLGASVFSSRAIERIYQVKERPRHMALPLLLADVSQITEVAEYVPQVAWLLASNFLPGALTMVLRKSGDIPEIVTAGGETVAVRIPAHPIPVALSLGVRAPIIGTSANLSGGLVSLTADEVYSQFGAKIDLVINGGLCPGGEESTIVDLTGGKPIILREGAIKRERLERVCEIN